MGWNAHTFSSTARCLYLGKKMYIYIKAFVNSAVLKGYYLYAIYMQYDQNNKKN